MVTNCRGILKSVNQTMSDPRDASESLLSAPWSCQFAPSEVKWVGKHRPFTLHRQTWGTQYLIISVTTLKPIMWHLHPLHAVISFLNVFVSKNKCNTLNVVWKTSHLHLHTYHTVKSPSSLMAGCSVHLHVAVWGGSSTNHSVGDGSQPPRVEVLQMFRRAPRTVAASVWMSKWSVCVGQKC